VISLSSTPRTRVQVLLTELAMLLVVSHLRAPWSGWVPKRCRIQQFHIFIDSWGEACHILNKRSPCEYMLLLFDPPYSLSGGGPPTRVAPDKTHKNESFWQALNYFSSFPESLCPCCNGWGGKFGVPDRMSWFCAKNMRNRFEEEECRSCCTHQQDVCSYACDAQTINLQCTSNIRQRKI
jgi:hypothetical protein